MAKAQVGGEDSKLVEEMMECNNNVLLATISIARIVELEVADSDIIICYRPIGPESLRKVPSSS